MQRGEIKLDFALPNLYLRINISTVFPSPCEDLWLFKEVLGERLERKGKKLDLLTVLQTVNSVAVYSRERLQYAPAYGTHYR